MNIPQCVYEQIASQFCHFIKRFPEVGTDYTLRFSICTAMGGYVTALENFDIITTTQLKDLDEKLVQFREYRRI